jgi:type VI secretion system secreted protein VgrG
MAAPLSSSASLVRGVKVTTALGENAFSLRSFRYREAIGQPFEGLIEAVAADGAIDLESLLGKPATVSVPLPSGGTRHFSGICLEARQTGRVGDAFTYRLVIVPWLQLLELAADCRIFQQKTAKEILSKVFDDLGLTDHKISGLVGDLPELEFCAQFDETHLNFVQRLTQRFGIGYFTEHAAGTHTVSFTDSHSSHAPFPGYDKIRYAASAAEAANAEHVFLWETGRRMATGKVVLKDYDFTNPSSKLEATDSAGHGYPHGDLERFEYPGSYTKQSDGTTIARIRMGEQACNGTFFTGSARCYGLSAGFAFKLDGHPRGDQNASYLTTAIDLVIEPVDEAGAGGAASRGAAGAFACTCSFEAIPADVDYRPPRTARIPRIDGVQTAVVVGPTGQDPRVPYTDPYASVRVQFHWDRNGQNNEKSSCWLRHAQVFAGSGWGATFLPLVGCEVVVAFIGGDPDRPLVLGGVYNGDHKPPRELPKDAVKTVIQDVAGNFLVLDGQQGKESITMFTSYRENWWTIGSSENSD